MTGNKFDNGKPKLELLFLEIAEASSEVAKVLEMGENKYGLGNYDKLDNAERRYSGALLRHMSSHIRGDIIDEESGLHHIAHVAANALFLLQMRIDNERVDKSPS